MTTYNTRNPVGSAAAKDFYDNAQNLDYWANSSTLEYSPDRFGLNRLTINGMQVKYSAQMLSQALQFDTQIADQAQRFGTQLSQEDRDWRQQMQSQLLAAIAQRQQAAADFYSAIQASGYQILGSYTAGVVLTGYNQIVILGGNQYRAASTTTLPYTLTGTTTTDMPFLVSAGSGVLETDLADNAGPTKIGAKEGGTLQQKLGWYVTVEQFGDVTGDAAGAIQSAIDFAIAHKIPNVIGGAYYKSSVPLRVANAGSQFFSLRLMGLEAADNFMAPTEVNDAGETVEVDLTVWNAPPLIKVGDDASNMTNLQIHVDYMDGKNVADGVGNYGFGFALSHIHIGYATGCVRVVSTGNHTWPNASMRVTGNFWTGNGFGVVLKNGTGNNSPIVEGWKIEVLFTAANKYPGVWFDKSGNYAQIRGDFDFNGQDLSFCRLSAETDSDLLDNKQNVYLTNGTTASEFLCRYVHQKRIYVVLREDHNVSLVGGTGSSYAAGDTLKAVTAGYGSVSLTVDEVKVARDNASGTNYPDILHDFTGIAFAAVHIDCGYLSEIKGGLLHTSNIEYQNSFNRISNSNNGFAVGNDGSNISFYNLALSDDSFFVSDRKFFYFDRYYYAGYHRLIGQQFETPVASSTTEYTDVFTISDLTIDKVGNEGTILKVVINSNYGSQATFVLRLKGNQGCAIVSPTETDDAFEYIFVQMYDDDGVTPIGVKMKIRQEAQDKITFLTSILRDN